MSKIIQLKNLKTIKEIKEKNEDIKYWIKFEKERKKFDNKLKMICKIQFKKEKKNIIGKIKELEDTNLKVSSNIVPITLYSDWKHILEKSYQIIGKYFFDRQLKILRSEEFKISKTLSKKQNSLQTFDELNTLREDVGDEISDVTTNITNIMLNLLNPSKREDEDNRYWYNSLLLLLNLYMASKINSIVETTRNSLISAILESEKNGETSRQLQERINVLYNNFINVRSGVIANTEVAGASNFGNRTASDRSGLPLIHTWIATMDNRVRDIHRVANGQTKIKEEPFLVGGELLKYPHDTSLGSTSKNLVNCRCSERVKIDLERYNELKKNGGISNGL